MQTAAAYIRVSTEDQTEYSPDSQLKKIQEYATDPLIQEDKFLWQAQVMSSGILLYFF